MLRLELKVKLLECLGLGRRVWGEARRPLGDSWTSGLAGLSGR